MFMDQCGDISNFNEQCSKQVMIRLGVDAGKVQSCIGNAEKRRTGKQGSIIPFFEEDREWGKKLGVILHPQITINNITYRGSITGLDIFKAICAGFFE